MNIARTSLFGAALVCGIGSTASAATILEYTTQAGMSLVANGNTAAEVTATNMVAGSGLTAQTFSTFNHTGWDTTSTTFEAAVAVNDYGSWGFTVTDAVNINLTEMNFRIDRSGTGPDDAEIRVYVNGSSTGTSVFTHDYNDSTSGVTFTGVSLAGISTLTQGDSVEFVLAAFNSEDSGGSFDLETVTFPGGTDSMQIVGDITAIPEPASIALLGLGGLVMLRRRK